MRYVYGWLARSLKDCSWDRITGAGCILERASSSTRYWFPRAFSTQGVLLVKSIAFQVADPLLVTIVSSVDRILGRNTNLNSRYGLLEFRATHNICIYDWIVENNKMIGKWYYDKRKTAYGQDFSCSQWHAATGGWIALLFVEPEFNTREAVEYHSLPTRRFTGLQQGQ